MEEELGSGYTTKFTGGFSNGNGGQIYLFENTVYDGVFSSPPPEVAGAINPPNYTETLWYPEQVYVPIVVNLSVDPPSVSQSITLDEDTSGKVTNTPLTGSIAFTDDDVATTPTASLGTQTATATNYEGNAITLTAEQVSALEAAFTVAPKSGNSNNGNIDWTYNPDGTALNFLAAGETAVVTSTVNLRTKMATRRPQRSPYQSQTRQLRCSPPVPTSSISTPLRAHSRRPFSN